MTVHPEFAYVQARLQARHGGLPEPLAWQVLEASRTASHYLALARSGPMATWVEGLEDASDAHRIERHLRSRWRHYVDELSSWLPPRWQPAARWFGMLSDLALIDALQRGTHTARWLQRDEPLVAYAQPAPELTGRAVRAAGLAALAGSRSPDARGRDGNIATRWLDEWTRLLPADVADPALLLRPAELLLPRLLGADNARAAANESTRHALLQLFRRHAASAVAALAHLALVALDVERLRGGLVVRALFEVRPEPQAA